MMVLLFGCLGDLWLIINWLVVNINCLIYFGVGFVLVEDIGLFWVDFVDFW